MSKRWKKIVLYALLPVAVIGGFLYWLTWSGSTDDIIRVANQFKAPSSWKLVSNHADPPRTICIAQKCPELSRTWELPSPIKTPQDFETIARLENEPMKISESCFVQDSTEKNPSRLCDAYMIKNQYTLHLNYSGYGTSPTVYLHIEEKR